MTSNIEAFGQKINELYKRYGGDFKATHAFSGSNMSCVPPQCYYVAFDLNARIPSNLLALSSLFNVFYLSPPLHITEDTIDEAKDIINQLEIVEVAPENLDYLLGSTLDHTNLADIEAHYMDVLPRKTCLVHTGTPDVYVLMITGAPICLQVRFYREIKTALEEYGSSLSDIISSPLYAKTREAISDWAFEIAEKFSKYLATNDELRDFKKTDLGFSGLLEKPIFQFMNDLIVDGNKVYLMRGCCFPAKTERNLKNGKKTNEKFAFIVGNNLTLYFMDERMETPVPCFVGIDPDHCDAIFGMEESAIKSRVKYDDSVLREAETSGAKKSFTLELNTS